MDRESQIKAIEKTFEDNKKTIERHYSKPNVVPIEVLPVYPDFKVGCLLFTVIYIFYFLSVLYSFCYLFVLIFSYGNIHVPKLYLILILRRLVGLYLHRLRKCRKL